MRSDQSPRPTDLLDRCQQEPPAGTRRGVSKMPVLLDRVTSGHLVLGGQCNVAAAEFLSCKSLDVVLVNNMPDASLEATDRQFAGLLAAAAGDQLIRLKLF